MEWAGLMHCCIIFHNCCFWVVCEVGGAYRLLHYLIFPPVIPAACAAALSPVYTCTKTPHLSITCHLESRFINITGGCANTVPAQVIVHILLQLRHLLLCNRRPCDQLGALPLLSFLVEIYCVYQGDDSKAVLMVTCGDNCVCLYNILQ